jgi:hypothetical protein
MTNQFDHLDALKLGLSHERARLASATNLKEIALRKVWIAQKEREIESEYKFLGIAADDGSDLSIDNLFAELSA